MSPLFSQTNMKRFSVFILFLILIYGFSTGVRLHQHEVLSIGETVLTTDDGYRWVRFAKEISEGSYVKDDDALSPAAKPPAVPLISRTISAVSGVSGLSFERAGSLMTVFLSGLFIFPLGMFFYLAGYPASGVGAGLLGALSFAYLSRTSAYQIDTDMLNLFFLSMGALCVFMAERGRAVLWSALAGITMYIFWLWYFHSGFTLVYFLLLMFAVRSHGLWAISLSAFVYIVLASPFVFFSGFMNLFQFVDSSSVQHVYADVAELTVLPFTETMKHVGTYWWLAVIGLLLSVISGRHMVFMAVFYLLGLFAFTKGIRFAMFLSPLCGAGIGVLFDKCLPKRCALGYAMVTACLIFIPVYENLYIIPEPSLSSETAALIKHLDATEKDAVIAGIWDKGFAIEHLAGRRVLADGASQFKQGAKAYADAIFQTDERASADMLYDASESIHVYLLFTPDMDNKMGGLLTTAGYKAVQDKNGVILTGIGNAESSQAISLEDTVYFRLAVIGTADMQCFRLVYADGGALRLYRLNQRCLKSNIH
jgi:dolichyl-diphosphooligosaccharide--protein glycosyltransferase